MKKLSRLALFSLLFCFVCSGVIHADAIVEPQDSFYQKHSDELSYLPRSYTANAKEGYVSLYKSPESSRVRENVANGERLSCSFLYTDSLGQTWGAVRGERDALRGWVRLSDCVPVPDYLSFAEQHESEFVGFDEAFQDALKGVSSIVLWSYPGSGSVAADGLDAQWFDGDLSEHFTTCWRDGDGRFWAYVSYCYGVRNTWLCLSAPDDSTLPADPDVLPAGPELIPAAEDIPSPGLPGAVLAATLIVGVVAASAVLIRIFFRH